VVLPEGLLTFAADYGAGRADRGHGVVMSTSRRRMARTSPIRAEVLSVTSFIAPSWPSGFGPVGRLLPQKRYDPVRAVKRESIQSTHCSAEGMTHPTVE
jgi:hypothetical protein